MRDLIIGEKVPVESRPASLYSVNVRFDDSDLDCITRFEDKEETIAFYDVYNQYLQNLSDNWNYYCNPEWDDVSGYFEEYFEVYGEWETSDVWHNSNEYDCMARVSSVNITYFDENGVEWKVKVQ